MNSQRFCPVCRMDEKVCKTFPDGVCIRTYSFWRHMRCIFTARHWNPECLTIDGRQCRYCGIKSSTLHST